MFKQELDQIPMSRGARLRAEAELRRAEVIVDIVSRAGSTVRRWVRLVVESILRGRRAVKAAAAG